MKSFFWSLKQEKNVHMLSGTLAWMLNNISSSRSRQDVLLRLYCFPDW